MIYLLRRCCLTALLAFCSVSFAQTLNISITPPVPGSLVAGGAPVIFTASGTPLAGGVAIPISAGLTWTSSNETVLHIDKQTGAALALQPGVATIQASLPGENAMPLAVVVAPALVPPAVAALTAITVTPNPVILASGASVTLNVMGTYGLPGGPQTFKPIPSAQITLSDPAKKSLATVAGATITAATVTTKDSTSTTVTVPVSAVPAVAPLTQTVTITVTPPGAAASAVLPDNPTKPAFVADVPANSTALIVSANTGDSLSVYGFLPGYGQPINDCKKIPDAPDGLRLLGTFTASSPDAAGNFTLPLALPVTAGYTLCLAEKTATTAAAYSNPKVVQDFDNNWRVRTYFIFGMQANNQISTTATTPTAGQYIEVGYNTEWIRAMSGPERFRNRKAGTPGFSSNIDVRFSPIPVSAVQTTTTAMTVTTPATSTTAGTSTTTASAVMSPNVLSSQQSVRAVESIYFPWKATSDKGQNFLTIAPIARAGFGTLINPTNPSPSTSSGAMTSASTTTTAVSTATSFSSAYYFWAVGTRFAWDQYNSGKDRTSGPSPVPMGEILFTFGKYSNLPSYVCSPLQPGNINPYTNTTTTITTSCNQGSFAVVANGNQKTFVPSRTVRPRLDIEAFFRPPNTPLVLGMEANLQQSALFGQSNLDIQNKPGNDVRVFVGLTINLATLLAKFGSPTL